MDGVSIVLRVDVEVGDEFILSDHRLLFVFSSFVPTRVRDDERERVWPILIGNWTGLNPGVATLLDSVVGQ